jgi:mycothiol synthase
MAGGSVDGVTELTTQPYEPADAPAVAELLNAVSRHAGAHAGLEPGAVQAYLAAGVPDLATDSRVLRAPDGTVVAVAVVRLPPGDGRTQVELAGAVHPDWRGRGLGRELLGWQISRAREIRQAVAPDDAGWSAHTGAELGDHASVRLYQRFGMTPVRYWFSMVADTAAAPAVPPPDGLRMEPYAARHEPVLHRAHMEAFADHWQFHHRTLAEWAPLTVRSEPFRPDLSRLAFDRDELAGYLLGYRDAAPDRLYIGQVGVRPGWRRRGLAGALLAEVLAAAAAAGLTRAGLGVDADSPTGAVGVYQRVGFTVESRAVTYATPLG